MPYLHQQHFKMQVENKKMRKYNFIITAAEQVAFCLPFKMWIFLFEKVGY